MYAVNRDLDLSERDLFSSVNNGLSSLLNPLFPGQTTSQTSTSATITLTQSATATDTATNAATDTTTDTATDVTDTATQSATSTATPTTPSTSSTVVSTESSSASSSSSSSASASPSTAATSSADASSTAAPVNDPAPTSVATSVSAGPQGTITLTSTSSAASSSTSVAAAANAAASKGFLANKGLSVGVITACSLVGLVLIIIFATWTIRRRRRDKLHDEAIDFSPFPSSDGLLGSRNDVERGGGGGTNRTRPSSRGSANSVEEILSSSTGPPKITTEMYQTAYPVLPTFMPTTGPAPPPKAATTSTTNQIAFPSQAYANPALNYNDYGSYPSYANGYQPAASTLPPGPGPTYNTAYGTTPAPAPANAPVRKASQRKQVPPLNLSAARANPPAYQATQTTDNAATPTLANPYGTTPNLTPDPPLSAVSPRAKRGSASLLNSPVHLAYSDEGSEGEGKTRNRTSSHSRALDPNLPQLPRAGPLPDQFGAQSDVAVRDEKAAIRQLTVRNE